VSDTVYFSFSCDSSRIAAWENFFSILAEVSDCRSVRLESAIAVFGRRPLEGWQAIFDEDSCLECFIFEDWSREENEFQFQFDIPEDYLDAFEAFFESCEVGDLDITALE